MNKYKNKKTVLDGFIFDSKKEAHHYSTLKTWEKQGKISDLKCQVKFEIVPKSGNNKRAHYYIADFTYITITGEKIIDDVKSPATKKNAVYRLKKALVLSLYPDWTFIES